MGLVDRAADLQEGVHGVVDGHLNSFDPIVITYYIKIYTYIYSIHIYIKIYTYIYIFYTY